MSKDDALKKCLRVLEPIAEQRVYETQWIVSAILACKEALEQPIQERAGFFGRSKRIEECAKEWQGLSEEEINSLIKEHTVTSVKLGGVATFWMAIEQKLKEKNK